MISSLDCTLLRRKVLQIEKGVCKGPTFLNLEDFPSKKSAIQAENHKSLSSSGGPGIQILQTWMPGPGVTRRTPFSIWRTQHRRERPPGRRKANTFLHLEDPASQGRAPRASKGEHLSSLSFWIIQCLCFFFFFIFFFFFSGSFIVVLDCSFLRY